LTGSKVAQRRTIGWREWVTLPDITAVPIKAKIDTGAATSALHAHRLSIVERDGEEWAEFEVHPVQRSRLHAATVALPVRAHRVIRSSSGHAQRRPVVSTRLHIGRRTFRIELTLTARDEMGFRLLLGRAAVRRRFVIDAGASYLTDPNEDDQR
jgi:hypothetical protein